MGAEATERVQNWNTNQKRQGYQENSKRKANEQARTSQGMQTWGSRYSKTGWKWTMGDTQWQPGCSSMDWEPTGWSRLKWGARIWGSSAAWHTVMFFASCFHTTVVVIFSICKVLWSIACVRRGGGSACCLCLPQRATLLKSTQPAPQSLVPILQHYMSTGNK